MDNRLPARVNRSQEDMLVEQIKYRIFDRYNRPVASLAVLADDDPDWRPNEFRSDLFGCEAGIRFPTVKLLDFAAQAATPSRKWCWPI